MEHGQLWGGGNKTSWDSSRHGDRQEQLACLQVLLSCGFLCELGSVMEPALWGIFPLCSPEPLYSISLSFTGGACYSWGWNEHGMCGDGTEANVWAPKPVQVPLSARGLLVGCGAGHSLALCQLPGQPALGKDLNITYHTSDATEDTESQEALDKEQLEGETEISTQSQPDKSRNEGL